jgi:hypothetical protein
MTRHKSKVFQDLNINLFGPKDDGPSRAGAGSGNKTTSSLHINESFVHLTSSNLANSLAKLDLHVYYYKSV